MVFLAMLLRKRHLLNPSVDFQDGGASLNPLLGGAHSPSHSQTKDPDPRLLDRRLSRTVFLWRVRSEQRLVSHLAFHVSGYHCPQYPLIHSSTHLPHLRPAASKCQLSSQAVSQPASSPRLKCCLAGSSFVVVVDRFAVFSGMFAVFSGGVASVHGITS